MKHRFLTWMLVLVAWPVLAGGGPAAVRKQIESSMLVAGSIDIKPDGAVAGYKLDREQPKAIADMIQTTVMAWRFEPPKLDGAALGRSKMSLRLVAMKQEDGNFLVKVRGAQFSSAKDEPSMDLSSNKLSPPRYPEIAARAGVNGTVYMVVKVGRDGRVEDVIVEQTNLRVIDSESGMARWRGVLAEAALRAAKKWTFNPPTKGEEVDAPYWSARVPVDFMMQNQKLAKETEWNAYVPGPTQQIPWRIDETSTGADAIAAGGVYPLNDRGPRLLTPLAGG